MSQKHNGAQRGSCGPCCRFPFLFSTLAEIDRAACLAPCSYGVPNARHDRACVTQSSGADQLARKRSAYRSLALRHHQSAISKNTSIKDGDLSARTTGVAYRAIRPTIGPTEQQREGEGARHASSSCFQNHGQSDDLVTASAPRSPHGRLAIGADARFSIGYASCPSEAPMEAPPIGDTGRPKHVILKTR